MSHLLADYLCHYSACHILSDYSKRFTGKGKNKEAFGRYDTTKHCAVGNAQEYYPDHIA